MNIKQELIDLKNKITNSKADNYNPTEIKLLTEEDTYITPIILNDKIEEFIKWDKENMEYLKVCNAYRVLFEIPYHNHKIVRKLIEKIASWYELRYPNYEIDRIFDNDIYNSTTASKEMFINNPYIKNNHNNQNRINKSEISNLEWIDFYNRDGFYSLLSEDEKVVFNPKYPSSMSFHMSDWKACYLKLTPDGIILEDKTNFLDEDLTGKHIEEFSKLLDRSDRRKDNIPNRIDEEIKRYKKRIFIREQVLTCAMYKIIENGSYLYGPERALLFAKEFGLNIHIPLMYGLTIGLGCSEENSFINLINEYLNLGGNPDLICYKNYFLINNKKEKLLTKKLSTELQILQESQQKWNNRFKTESK